MTPRRFGASSTRDESRSGPTDRPGRRFGFLEGDVALSHAYMGTAQRSVAMKRSESPHLTPENQESSVLLVLQGGVRERLDG